MSKSISFTDSYARYSASDMPMVPRPLSALHASLIDSRSCTCDDVSGCRPFDPGRAPRSIFDLSMYRSAAWRCLRTMYGHISAIVGPIASPFNAHSHEGRAFFCFGKCGPDTAPPAIDLHRSASTSSVVAIEMVANHEVASLRVDLPIMYDPSPSSSPARYAASVGSISQLYAGLVSKPEYWATAVDNLTRLESDMSTPALFDSAAS